jgi:folate-binding protein YgfZ
MSNAANGGGTWARLPHLGVLRIAGADARPFLQGQLSNDMERLTHDETLLSALNTPQGRVVAILRLASRADGLIGILPAALITPVIDRLKRYVLRSRVMLTDESAQLGVAGLIDAPGAKTHTAAEGVSVHALPGPRDRHLLVAPAGTLERIAPSTDARPQNAERWRLAGIECGEPQIYPQTSDLFVAQMLNLDLVDGLSFTKGCYTGQEIIARTQHRGRIKRRMLRYRVQDSAALTPGDTVVVEHRVARVVEAAAREATESEMLAVVSLDESARAGPQHAAPNLTAERMRLPYPIPDLD